MSKGIPLKQKNGKFYLNKMINGKRPEISLQTENKKTAEQRGRRFIETARKSGIEAAKVELRGGIAPVTRGLPTIEAMVSAYRSYCDQSENPPRANTREGNVSTFESIAASIGIKTVGSLSFDKLNEYKAAYLKERKNSDSARRTLASRFRKAGSIFKKKALAYYQNMGLQIVGNPFAGVELPSSKVSGYTALSDNQRAILTKDAKELPPVLRMMFLLGLHAGLRRNEADKARFDWFTVTNDQVFLTIQATEDFRPKGKESRRFAISKALWTELQVLRGAAIQQEPESIREALASSPYLIPCRPEHHITLGKTVSYRLGLRWGSINQWVQERGAESFHSLRKEFGSMIAAKWGLHDACKILGHSSPQVTLNHYSAYLNTRPVDIGELIGL